jgi:16S rRNA (guanine966-N2)-methyltransferase
MESTQPEAVVRISGGIACGVPLTVPKGDAVRPATDGMRQAVFSSLGARPVGAVFWDLFAGSGAYGLEALSRGAAGGIFVERNPKALGCLRSNLAAVGKSMGRTPEAVRAIEADVLSWVSTGREEAADLVFVDPPYEVIADVAPVLFLRLAGALAARPEALVLFEMPGELDLAPEGWTCLKRIGRGRRQPTVACFRRS